jgi:pheromone shutdown protein TraB
VHRFSTGRIPIDLIIAILRDLVYTTVHAAACWLGGLVGSVTRIRVRLYSPVQYDSTLLDPPRVQAEHEAGHLSRQRAFLKAVEAPPARQLIDEIRDESMSERIADLRTHGDVAVVVGMEHLDPIYERLKAGR